MTEDVLAVIKVLTGSLEQVVKKLTLDITANLIKTTPVLTGWARANWVPSIGSPVTQTSGTRKSAEQGQLDLTPQQSGIAKIASQYKVELGNVYITNNVPYITRLNEGSSKKAPAAFVQQAIFKGIQDNKLP